VTVELTFPPQYFAVSDRSQIKVCVGQVRSCYDANEPIMPIGIAWTLERVVRELILALPDTLTEPSYDFTQVESVMDASGCPDFQVCLEALRQCKFHASDAIMALADNGNRPRLEHSVMEESARKLQRQYGTQSNLDSSTSVSDPVRQLSAMFAIPFEAAALTLDIEQNVEAAAVRLSDPEFMIQMCALAADSTASYFDTDSKMSSSSDCGMTAPSLQRQTSQNSMTRMALQQEFATHNYVVEIACFFEQQLKTIHLRCMICDDELPYAGLKPTICNKPLCKMGYEQLAIGFNLDSIVLHQGSVLDLLITLCSYACSERGLTFVNPVGIMVRDNADVEHSFIKPQYASSSLADGKQCHSEHQNLSFRAKRKKAKKEQKACGTHSKSNSTNDTIENDTDAHVVHMCDIDKVAQMLRLCPSIRTMQQHAATGQLKAQLNTIHVLLYPMLMWLWRSNRAYLRPLKPCEQIKSMKTPHQFVLLTSPPEREARFRRLREYVLSRQAGNTPKVAAVESMYSATAAADSASASAVTSATGEGTVLAFHGSAARNWHSILRIGLKNMSNSKYMTAGAAHGAGIYLATSSATSASYSSQNYGGRCKAWAQSQYGPSASMVALCEIVQHPNLKPPTPHYVISEEEWVRARFLFVYGSGATGIPHVNAESLRTELPL
jgi:Poly(ADP-ribose) polymerase catalytic domain